MRRLLSRIGLAVAALFAAQPALAAWAPNADDALLLDVRLNQYRLGDGVRGYATPSGTCVDLADMILALDLPIRLDKQSRRATGWAFAENHTLTIDRVNGEEHIMNNAAKVAPDDIRDTPEGWCVSTKALSRWLGVTLDADRGNALLIIKSDKKLPPQLAAERRARVAAAPVTFDLASLPHASAPWRGIKPPAIDIVASAGGLRDRRSGNRMDAQYELYASGEAGPVAYDARLSSTRNGAPATLRLRAYRTDPEGKLPLHATQIAAGDVTGLSSPLVAQSSVGRGIMITNRPVDLPTTFDRTDFRGELPRGWDAELYRNGQLLAFANDRADGRYEFLDVLLLYGTNRFEIVLYGPQGQVRREVKSVAVGLDSIPPKKTWYWAGIDEDGRDLIDLNHAPNFGQRGWRGSLGIERGLDARTSVAALLHSLVLDDAGRKNYIETSVRRAIGPALAELSASGEAGGGSAVRAQVIGEAGRTHYGIETIWANGGYESDRVLKDVTGLHSFTVDHDFGEGRGAIPVHVDARYTTRRTGYDSIDLASRASANLGPLSLTGELSWRDEWRRHYGPDPPGVMEAGLLANARVGRVRLRGEAHWRLSPENRFESATLVGEWSAGRDDLRLAEWRTELGYDRALHRGRAGIGYARRFDRFALTGTGEIATDGAVAAGLNLAFSIGPDPRRGRAFRVTSDKLAARGATLVRVYRDTNGNGRRDPDEPLEKDVQVAAGRVPVDRLTDADGEVVVDGLEPFQPVLIGIDTSSLADPFVQPSTAGLVVTPRPGVALAVELPLVSAGDVDGTLVRGGGGNLEGVDLELLDAEGRIAARTRSDFDGFFLFERVPYGRYNLRIAALAAQATRLAPALGGMASVSAKTPSAHLGAVAAQPAPRMAAN
ncbi:MAG: carboxypeptidase regulatory-like domain-containing protein [Sphingomonadaceae bacterium]|nr:carboxypeptidase regulatory-like domain-containing protein [Sphingomonadaceae bacterium]